MKAHHRMQCGVIVLVSLFAFIACGVKQPLRATWDSPQVGLPGGTKYATYDAEKDTIWILSVPNRVGTQPVLTDYHPGSGAVNHLRITTGSVDGLGVGAALVASDKGVIVAWGNRVLEVDNSTHAVSAEWAIPKPRSDAIVPQNPGLDLNAVALAIDDVGGVWVALHSTKSLYRLDRTTGEWKDFPTGSVFPHRLCSIRINGAGVVSFTGVEQKENDFTPRLVSMTRRDGTTQTTAARRPIQLGGEADGSLFYLSDDGSLRRMAQGQDHDTALRVNIRDRRSRLFQVAGMIWTWEVGKGRVDIVALDVNAKTRASYPYPVTRVTPNMDTERRPGSGARGANPVADPAIAAVLADIRGDVWVLASNGADDGTATTYPPLSRLHVG